MMRSVLPKRLLKERLRLGWTPLSGLGAEMRTVASRLQVRTDGGIEEV